MEHERPEASKTDVRLDEIISIVEVETSELELQEAMTYCPPIAVSDRRLKTDIAPAGALPDGLKLYSWRYLGGTRRFTGVMADDLAASPAHAHAIHRDSDGLMRVDYGAVGYLPADFAAMQAEGRRAVAQYRQSLN